MGKKKNNNGDDHAENSAPVSGADEPASANKSFNQAAPRKGGILPSLSVGDILAIVALLVLSAALLLEGYHKDFRDYSKEIVALFAIVVGFLLGRKT